jgi:hypothetical protein
MSDYSSLKKSLNLKNKEDGEDAHLVKSNCEGICPTRYPHVKNVARRLNWFPLKLSSSFMPETYAFATNRIVIRKCLTHYRARSYLLTFPESNKRMKYP